MRWDAALKCDGNWLCESAMVRSAKVRWSQVRPKCDGTPHLIALVACHAKVLWYAALKCDGHMVQAKMHPFCFVRGMTS